MKSPQILGSLTLILHFQTANSAAYGLPLYRTAGDSFSPEMIHDYDLKENHSDGKAFASTCLEKSICSWGA